MEDILQGIKDDLSAIKAELDEVKNLRLTVENLNKIPSRVEVLEQEVESLKGQLRTKRNAEAINREMILEDRQYSRRDNLIISNVPVGQGENLRELVKALAASLGILLREWDIKVVHRLPNKNGIPKIVVKLHDREVKTEIIRRSKKNKLNSAFLNMDPDNIFPVYCEDHLIPQYQKVFAMARQLRKDQRLTFVEIRECAIRVAVGPNDQPIKVTSEEQLYELVQLPVPESWGKPIETIAAAPDTNASQSGGQKRDLDTRSPDTASNPMSSASAKKMKEQRKQSSSTRNLANGPPRLPKATTGLASPNAQRKMLQYVNSVPRSQLQPEGALLQHNLPVKPYSHPLVQSQPQPSPSTQMSK